MPYEHSPCPYSKVPNKRSATFISFRKIIQGLCSYLEGVHLLILTKYFFQKNTVHRKAKTKIQKYHENHPFIDRGYAYLKEGSLIISTKLSRGYVYLGGHYY